MDEPWLSDAALRGKRCFDHWPIDILPNTMKILIVSNLYPPHHQGGYELRCSQVAEHLSRNAHDVRVVTSSYRISGAGDGFSVADDRVNGVPVARFLRQHRLDPPKSESRLAFLDLVKRQVADATHFAEILRDFQPDLVSWWNMEGITKTILGMPREIPAVYSIEDHWMIRELAAVGDVDQPFWFDFWRVNWGPRLLRPILGACLAPLARRVEARGIPTRAGRPPGGHLCFISESRRFEHRQAGFETTESDVIHGGVAPEKFFSSRSPLDFSHIPLKLLYAGYVDEKRGLHTIVEAMGLLPPAVRHRVHLSVASAGPVVPSAYVKTVVRQIDELGLSSHVTFLGRVAHEEMPAVFAGHHVLVFASTYFEGLPLVMAEAMCAACAVITTGSGGAIELANAADLPLFPKEHPYALSRLLLALEKDRARLAEIALRGQQAVLRDFTFDRMMKRTSEVFSRVAGAASTAPHTPVLSAAGSVRTAEAGPALN